MVANLCLGGERKLSFVCKFPVSKGHPNSCILSSISYQRLQSKNKIKKGM